MNKFKAYLISNQDALKRGDAISVRSNGQWCRKHFAYVSDDGQVATQELGENCVLNSPSSCFNIMVRDK